MNRVLCLLTLLALAGTASAAATEGQRLYASCAGCHGTRGVAAEGGLPPLAGQSQAALVASLRALRDGSRSSTIMQQIAKGYTEEQLAQIAAYLATLQGAAR